jgi:hypothetical protein
MNYSLLIIHVLYPQKIDVYTVKKACDIHVPSRDVTYQTLSGR